MTERLMRVVDARRLTGPNVLQDAAGSVLDVALDAGQRDGFVAAWSREIAALRAEFGWSRGATAERVLASGVSLAFPAPLDALYAATAASELAAAAASAALGAGEPPDRDAALADIREQRDEESNPALLALAAAAAARGATLLWDDDEVSLGMGRHAQTWPARELPDPDRLDWDAFRDIPVGLVTGTNGKTTTVRLARHIAQSAGLAPGLCSTDWIAVGDRIVEEGDWSGPGGARRVLREPGVEIAILEAARGGLLRRGLGVERADAAVLTNVAEDHLGDFGSESVDELLEIKWVVSRAVRRDGTLILNADDARLVARARDYPGRIDWFGLEPDNPVLARHAAAGGRAYRLAGDALERVEGGRIERLCNAADLPIALGGAARHNLANALAAAALCERLGVAREAIVEGLRSMLPADNPGRSNVYEVAGRRVLVDFAHNPAAMQALFAMARSLPAKRRLLAFAQAGDRTDAQIRELAESAWAIGLERVYVSELEKYRRGRAPGEVYGLIRGALTAAGATPAQVEHHPDELAALDAALARARPGDLVIMLALAEGPAVRARLETLAARDGR